VTHPSIDSKADLKKLNPVVAAALAEEIAKLQTAK
jgi:hypothetical protein